MVAWEQSRRLQWRVASPRNCLRRLKQRSMRLRSLYKVRLCCRWVFQHCETGITASTPMLWMAAIVGRCRSSPFGLVMRTPFFFQDSNSVSRLLSTGFDLRAGQQIESGGRVLLDGAPLRATLEAAACRCGFIEEVGRESTLWRW